MDWRDHSIIGPGQCFGHVQAVAAHSPDEPGHWPQSPKLRRRKRFARAKLAGGMNKGTGRMIDNDQFGLVEIKHFPKFLGNSELIGAIFSWERAIISQGEKLFRVRLDVASMGQWKA